MILYVIDKGDPSVGLFQAEYQIQCPFDKEDMNPEELVQFKHDIENIYSDYSNGKLILRYDYEPFFEKL
jgi:hypothetical protein